MKKIISGLFFAILLLVMASCSRDTSQEGVVRILFNGTKPDGFELVYEEFLRRTQDTLNIRLAFTFVPPHEYRERLASELRSRRNNYDLVFDAPRLTLREFAAQGKYADLGALICFDTYPSFIQVLPPEVRTANLVNGRMYNIPLFRRYGNGIPVVFYRQDWADEWGIGTIDSFEKLEAYWQAARDRDILPLFLRRDAGFGTFLTFAGHHTEAVRVGIRGFTLANLVIMVHVKDGAIAAVAPVGAGDAAFAEFPPPFNRDFAMDRFEQFARWREQGFVSENSMTDTEGFFWAGESASAFGFLGDEFAMLTLMIDPDARIGKFVFDNDIRNLRPASMPNCLIMNNGLAIPSRSNRKNDTVRFLNWLFASKENNTLFDLGIEGIHHTINEDGTFHALTDYPLLWPGNSLNWNPQFTVLSELIPPEDRPFYKHELQLSSILWLPIRGFLFDDSDPYVRANVASVSEVSQRARLPLFHGIPNDGNRVFNSVTEMKRSNIEECYNAGLQQLKDTLVRQLNEHLRRVN